MSPTKKMIARIFGRKTPKTPPFAVKKERIYILPTGRGGLFTVVILAMVFGSLNYNNNAGFLFAFLLSSMCMISTLHTQKNLSGLTLLSERHTPVFAGEKVWFEFVLSAEKGPAYKICAGFKGEAKATHDIVPKEPKTFRVPFQTTKRGLFQPQRLVLSTTYPFGLFRTWVILSVKSDCVAFPKPEAHPFLFSDHGKKGEGKGSATAQGGDDFRELKAYRPGDAMGRIAWKNFAKGQGLWTRTFEAEEGPPLFLSWSTFKTPSREKRISQLSFLISEAHRKEKRFGLSLPGITIAPAESPTIHHRNRCLTALAVMPETPDDAP